MRSGGAVLRRVRLDLPVAGSAYTFSYATFGEFVAWIIGWDLVLELAVGAAVVAKGWSSYWDGVRIRRGHSRTRPAAPRLGCAADRRVVTTLLALGTKLSSNFRVVVTAIKVAVVLLVIIVGVFYIKAANYSPVHPACRAGDAAAASTSRCSRAHRREAAHYGWYGVLAGASIVFFAFIGFDIVATTAEETKNPQRDVPRGIFGSLAIVTVLYVRCPSCCPAWCPTPSCATAGEARQPGHGLHANGVDWAAKIIAVGALAGLTTVVMVLMLGRCRVIFAMARDGLLPPAGQDRRPTAPRCGITIGVGVVVARRGGVLPDRQARGDGQRRHAVRVHPGVVGVIMLRRKRPDLPRAFRVPPVPLLPIRDHRVRVADAEPVAFTWIRFAVWMVIGVVVYLFTAASTGARPAGGRRARRANPPRAS